MVSGTDALSSGAAQLSSGAAELEDGIKKYTDGTDTLANGVVSYVNGNTVADAASVDRAQAYQVPVSSESAWHMQTKFDKRE